MKKILALACLFIAVKVNAQIIQPRIVADFNAIECASGINVELTQGNENKVAVSAGDEKYLPELKTEVQNGVLKIYADYKEKLWRNDKNKKLKAFVTYKNINKLTGGSGAIVKAINAINNTELRMEMGSGATFTGEIKVTDLSIELSSGAVTKLTGVALNVKAELSSGAVFTGTELSTENCVVAASSGAVFKITATKTLSAKASSGASIRYNGEAELQHKNVSSGGSVRKL